MIVVIILLTAVMVMVVVLAPATFIALTLLVSDSSALQNILTIHFLLLSEAYKQFSMKFDHLILRKIIKFVATRCATMHQNRFRLGLCPRPRWGSLQRSPRPLAEFKVPTSKVKKLSLIHI